MELSARLKTISDMVKYRTVADIGTDHGYIPIYLVKSNKIDKAAGCDINKGPIMSATENIKRYGFEKRIDLRLGSGFEKIKENEFETAIISGMGGMLIIEIIKNDLECVKSFKQLIIQPQLDIENIRKFLHTIGFSIDEEEIILDDEIYYFVLSCSKGQDGLYSEIDYAFGKRLIKEKSPLLKDYVEIEKMNTKKIILDIKKTKNRNDIIVNRIDELNNYINKCNEVLKCL